MRTRRLRLLLTAVLIASTAGLLSAAGDEGRNDHPYLALGDSVSFGFIQQAGFQYVNPANFVGYPDYVASALRLASVNASCPGESSASFPSPTGPDQGCRQFRAAAPLHVAYGGTQASFAANFLATHRDTRLVTISLGANDLLLLQAACGQNPACVLAGLPATLAEVGANLTATLTAIRNAGYRRPVVVVNYYSVDYSDPFTTQATAALNGVLAQVAAANGAIVADTFTAFRTLVSNPLAGGSSCRAGLLQSFGLPPGPVTCDIHPAQSGHQVIAATIAAAVEHDGSN